MNFEEVCNYRRRKILLELSMAIGVVLENPQLRIIDEKNTTRAEMTVWKRDLVKYLQLFDDTMTQRPEGCQSEESLDVCLKEAQVQVQAMESALEEERSQYGRMASAILAEIAAEEMHLEKIEEHRVIEIAREMEKSADELTRLREEEDAITKKLQTHIDSCRIHLEVTLRGKNYDNERELHRKRSKIGMEYSAVLAKYDKDVGALHRTRDDLTDHLSQLEEKLKTFQDELVTHNALYTKLKTEREIAIHEAFVQSLENFKKNRAAKVIQRGWRSYYERSFMRKKKKTKKKKS